MIPVENNELRTMREASRDLGKMMKMLEQGTEKFVLTKHGKMVGVVITVEHYEELVGSKGLCE